MTKFDPVMAKLLERRLNPATAYPVGIMGTDASGGLLVGAVPPAGSLMFAGGFHHEGLPLFPGDRGLPKRHSRRSGGRQLPDLSPASPGMRSRSTRARSTPRSSWTECHKSADGHLFYEGAGNTPA